MKGSAWKIAWRSILGVAIAIGIGFYFLRDGSDAPRFVTAQVTRGSIIRSVSATGTVNPVTVVQVGSYVSGPIQALYADFNSPVKKGQLIAKIDPRPFEVKVAQARATLANARTQLQKDQANRDYAKLTYERNRKLLAQKVVSADQFDSARNTYEQANAQVALDRANIQQQEANLKEAEVNLGYTDIVSPVDGTVVSRNVDVGQTVAASFQTPTLFLIARDLTKMQVDTNVSESDIGNVHKGETARFSVDAFPDRRFEGVVSQVRQAPITVQNVVTYDVVVNVANPEFLLKPGMTADVAIITDRRDNAMRIPEQALRFSPGGLDSSLPPVKYDQASSRARVYVPSAGGGIEPVSIVTGLSDGNNVEVLSGPLRVDEKVVVDEIRPEAERSSSRPLHFPR